MLSHTRPQRSSWLRIGCSAAIVLACAVGIFTQGTSARSTPHSLMAISDPQYYAWHTFYGSSDPSEYSFEIGEGVAKDDEGNIYLVGQSPTSWQGNNNTSPLHAHSGGDDIIILKLDHDGNYLWHTFYGSSEYEEGYSIIVDAEGSVYVAGWSNHTWQGDGDVAPLHAHSGGQDIVVIKLNGNGAYQWHTFYGSPGFDNAYSVAVDGQDNVYVAGVSEPGWQGDGDISPKHAHSGGGDIVLLKLDKQGAYEWHTFFGSSAGEDASAVVTDGTGYIYLIGGSNQTWQGVGDVDPLHGYIGAWDIVAMKLTSNGDYQWHTFYGSSENERGLAIARDLQGNLILSGHSWATWQGSGGVDPLHAHSGSWDIFTLKLNDGGAYQWHTFYGSSGPDGAAAVVTDAQGKIYLTGSSSASWQGDGDENPVHPHSGAADILVLKLNGDGAYQWHSFYGSSDSDEGQGIVLDQQENPIISGYSFAAWFGDGGVNPLHGYSGGYDILALKLDADRLFLPYLQR